MGLQGSNDYAHLPYRLDTLIPRFLHASTGTRSLSDDPHPPVERVRMGMDELDRTARHLEEPNVVTPHDMGMDTWYPPGHADRYANVLRSLAHHGGGTLPVVPRSSGQDVSSESEMLPDAPTTEPIGRGGRPRIDILYDLLAQIYHDLLKLQIKEGGDRITPISYRLIRDRYMHDTGKTISEETIANRVKQWRADGHPWPPPYTEDDEDVCPLSNPVKTP